MKNSFKTSTTAATTILLLFCVLAALPPAPALAGGPSPESCASVGTITIQCYICRTGADAGYIKYQAQYSPVAKSCVNTNKARKMCSEKAGRILGLQARDMGVSYRYSLGGLLEFADPSYSATREGTCR